MELTKELFVIPNKENYILYAPLRGSILEVNAPFIKVLQDLQKGIIKCEDKFLNRLVDTGIVVKEGGKNKSLSCEHKNPLKSTSVTLIPTRDCNLSCLYCYSSAGEYKECMGLDLAKASIDFIIENAVKAGSESINVGFHGGGEPFMNFDLVKEIVKYSKERANLNNLKSKFAGVSNGILGDKKLEWITQNLDSLNISFDGSKDVQNIQRPMKGGYPSFEKVLSTVKKLEESKFSYGIRTTITNYSGGILLALKDCSLRSQLFVCGQKARRP